MRANEYRVLVTALEDGVRVGVRKAWKHSDSQPPTDDQIDIIIDNTVNSITEWFYIEHVEGDF